MQTTMPRITNTSKKVIYGTFNKPVVLFLVTITLLAVTKVESTVYTNIRTGCFRINVGETPQEVTLRLSCKEASAGTYITGINEISYWRPSQRGDAPCSDTGYDAAQCCQMTSANNPLCVTSLADDSDFLVGVMEKCENKTSCDVTGLPFYMRDCSDDCPGPNNNNINKLCWSRVIQITYLCEMEGNVVPVTAPHEETQTNTGTVIVLGVMIPVSFLLGVAVCFVFLRFCPALDKKEKQSSKYNASSSVSQDDQLTSIQYGDAANLEHTYCDADPVSTHYQKDDDSQKENPTYLSLVNSQTVYSSYTPIDESIAGQSTGDRSNKETEENTYYNT